MTDSEEEFEYEDVEPGAEKEFLLVPEPEPEGGAGDVAVDVQEKASSSYSVQPNAGFPGGFPTSSILFCVLMLVWTLLLVFYFAYVHAYMVWTQQNPPSPFNGLRITDVPFYNAAPVSAGTSEIYFSFDYYTWMTDYLLILLPPYGIGVLLVSVLQRKRSAAIFGIYFVGIFFILLELAKAVYWTLIWAGWFGLSCAKYQFCLSHDPGVPIGTTITQFKIAVIFAYIFAAFSVSVILIQSIVRSGRLYSLYINGKLSDRNNALQKPFDTSAKQNTAKRNDNSQSYPQQQQQQKQQTFDVDLPIYNEQTTQRRRAALTQKKLSADSRGKAPPRKLTNI